MGLPWLLRVKRAEAPAPVRISKRLLWLGAGVFLLGYLPIALSDYAPNPYDHTNRLNQVPDLGVVMAAIACWSLYGRPLWAERLGKVLCGLFLTAHVAFSGYWAESYAKQLQVRDLILEQRNDWPQGDTLLVLLDRRYVARKAIIFDAPYDITGAAQLWLDDPTRSGNVISQRLSFPPEGIRESGALILPYSSLRLLDVERGTLKKVDRAALRRLPPQIKPWKRSPDIFRRTDRP